MDNNNDIYERLKGFGIKLLFAAGVIALFFAVSAIFFSPQYDDKTLFQHDVVQYEGMCHDIMENREVTGEDAQWTGNMFGGMPATFINIDYPSQMVKGYVGGIVNWVGNPTAFIFFAMVAMWIAMLLFGVNRWVGIIAALAYGLSTYTILIIGAGHITKIWAMVYAPMMLGAVYYTLRRNMWIGAALTALFTSLEIGANHPQITYYFAIPMAALWISEGIYAHKEQRIRDWGKRTALLIVAGVFAIGSNFSPLWQTIQHQKETTRGGSELTESAEQHKKQNLDLKYMTHWSYGKAESFNMLVPNYMGGSSFETFEKDDDVVEALKEENLEPLAALPRYFGDQAPTAGPTYLGAVAIFLAIFGLIILPGRHKWWIVAACIIALLMAWGKNIMWLTELLYKYLPLYGKFRVPAMALVVLQWAVPMLAAVAVGYVITNGEAQQKRLRRALYWTTGIVGGLLLMFAINGATFHDSGRENTHKEIAAQLGPEIEKQLPDSLYDTLTEAREEALQADAWRSLFFVAIAAAVVWLLIERKRLGGHIMVVVALCASLAALATIDLYTVDKRFLNEEKFVPISERTTKPTEADKYIIDNNTDGARVYNLTVSPFNDATTSIFHRSIGGYHGAKLSRYQDLIDRYLSVIDYTLRSAENDTQFYDALNHPVLDMLNVKYVIAGPDERYVWERTSALGNAWMIGNVVKTESADEEMELLGDDKFNPYDTAIAGAKYSPSQSTYSGRGEVELVEYRPNYLRYESNTTDGLGLVVFSEIFTEKGWTVKIDGKEVTPFRVNYVLRAVEVPEGEHTIEWSYRAPNWETTEGVTYFFSITILISCLAALIYIIKNERRQENKA